MQPSLGPAALQLLFDGKHCSIVLREGYFFWKHSTEQTTKFALVGRVSFAYGRLLLQVGNWSYDCAIEGVEVIAPEKSE